MFSLRYFFYLSCVFMMVTHSVTLTMMSPVSHQDTEWEITSFNEFKRKYSELITYPELVDTHCPDKKHNIDLIFQENTKLTYANNNPIVSLKELLHAIRCAGEKIGQAVSTAPWINSEPLPQSFFTAPTQTETIDFKKPEHVSLFAAFEKKLLLDEKKGEKAVFCGDLHGGNKSLIEVLKNYIDGNSFKLKDSEKDTHLIFCGDFVDSGKDGAEVLYLLARIAAENPEHVHLIRGNHEDQAFNKQQMFYQELAFKYGTINPDETFFYKKYSLNDKIYNAICRFYDFMPVALFMGNRRYAFTDYCYDWRIICHGGFEVGDVGIPELLASPHPIAYKLVGEPVTIQGYEQYRSIIRRKTVFDEIQQSHPLDVSVSQDDQHDFNQTITDFIPISPRVGLPIYEDGGFNTTDYRDSLSLGNCWSLFNEQEKPDLSYTIALNAWVYGKKLTEILLKRSSTWRNKIVGMVRAHQHVNNASLYTKLPLMENMIGNKGIWSLWQTRKEQNPAQYGAITTLMVAPDTVYGIPDEAQKPDEKHYPGIVRYSSLTLQPKAQWGIVKMESITKEFDILPESYIKNHNRLLTENQKKGNVQPPKESHISSKSNFSWQNAVICTGIGLGTLTAAYFAYQNGNAIKNIVTTT